MKHTWVDLSTKASSGATQDLNPIQDAVALASGKTEAVARSIQDIAVWAEELEKSLTVADARLDAVASHMAVIDSRPSFNKAEFERRLGAEVASIRNETAMRVKALESATKHHVESIQGDLATLHSLEKFLVKDIEDLEKQLTDQFKSIVIPQLPKERSTWPSYVAMVLAVLAIALHFIPL